MEVLRKYVDAHDIDDFQQTYQFHSKEIGQKLSPLTVKDPIGLAYRLFHEELILLQTPQRCKECGVVFLPINNLESMQCTYHPGTPFRQDRNRWRCCGTSVMPVMNGWVRGCRPCTHRRGDRKFGVDVYAEIPVLLVDTGIVKIHPAMVVERIQSENNNHQYLMDYYRVRIVQEHAS